MKKILFVMPQLFGGGIEKSLLEVITNLDSKKYDITIIALASVEKKYEDFFREKAKVKVILKNNDNKYRKVLNLGLRVLINCLPARWQWKLLIHEKYDVEIAYTHGMVTRLVSGSPYTSRKYTWIHNDLSEQKLAYFPVTEKMMQKSYTKFDKVLAVSRAAADAIEKRYNIKCDVQYNIVDKDDIINKAKQLQWERPKEFTIVTAGRLEKIKGYDRLLAVHKRLIEEGIHHHLYIVGEGSEHGNLSSFIEENKLSETAHLMGYQDNPYPYIKNADLFVCSSLAEGVSLVLCEAIVLETPIVSTYVCGSDELFGNSEYGLVVENSEEGLYDGIKKMILDKEMYNKYQERMMERINFFDKEDCIKRLEYLLDKD